MDYIERLNQLLLIVFILDSFMTGLFLLLLLSGNNKMIKLLVSWKITCVPSNECHRCCGCWFSESLPLPG